MTHAKITMTITLVKPQLTGSLATAKPIRENWIFRGLWGGEGVPAPHLPYIQSDKHRSRDASARYVISSAETRKGIGMVTNGYKFCYMLALILESLFLPMHRLWCGKGM